MGAGAVMPQQPIVYDDNGNIIQKTPVYDDNGNDITLSSPNNIPQPIGDDIELEEVPEDIPFNPVSSHTPSPSLMNQVGGAVKAGWDKVNTPILDLGAGRQGHEVQMGRQMFGEQNPTLGKIADFGLSMMDTAVTPLNLATGGFMGAGKALSAPRLVRAGRALSAPTALEGGINLAHPDSSMAERGVGALELAAGIAGMRAKLPTKIADVPEVSITNALNVNEKFASAKVVVPNPTKDVIESLARQGYRPGGVVSEGPNKGRVYMVLSPDDPARIKAKEAATPSLAREIWNLPRGMSTTFDMSAPLRQGLPLIGTKQWWNNWVPMVKAWGSQKSYDVVMKSIEDNPLFQKKISPRWMGDEWEMIEKPSIAQKAGLAMTDLGSWTRREEAIQSQLVEKIPGFGAGARASNRAYTAFLNKLRADTFTQLYEQAAKLSDNGKVSDKLAEEIAGFVNDATGRGKLATQLPNIEFGKKSKIPKLSIKERSAEGYSEGLSNAMFSPRLAASRLRMLNPLTYTQASPFVRKQYLKAAFNTAAAWTTAASVGSLAGGDVSLNPTNADFGKIKFGDLRIDPGGGFQQFLAAYARMVGGVTTSSTSGNTRELGAGYQPDTRGDIAKEFVGNKLHPILKLAYDTAFASDYRPVQVGDRVLQMYAPLVAQDLLDIIKSEDKNSLPPEIVAAVASFFGMGSQIYGKGGGASNLAIPPEYDFTFKGGILPGMDMFISHPDTSRSRTKKVTK